MAGVGILDPKKGIIWTQQEMTPDAIARQRELADAILQRAGDTSPVGSWTQGAARVVDALGGVLKERRADQAEATNAETNKGLISALLGTSGVSPSTVAAPGSTAASGSPVTSGLVAPGDPNDIQTAFLDTVKNGYDVGNGQKLAVTNPYGLAAIAATGKAESGFSPQNAGRTWADGVNNAGGIMSWNGPRLAALQKFSGGSNGTPEQQGQFFLQENPQLVTALNNAKSVEEAQNLMNNAWAFKGYNQPGNANAAHRLALANGYLPQFQGSQTPAAAAIQQQAPIGGQQVASLDPSAGIAAPSPVSAPAPFNPATATPDQLQAALGPVPQQQQVLPPNVPIPTPRPSAPVVAPPQQIAQAAPASAPPSGNSLGLSPAIVNALTSPVASPQVKQIAALLVQKEQARQQALYEQQLKQADPEYQLGLQKAQWEVQHLGQVTPDTQAQINAQNNRTPDSVKALDERAQRIGLAPGTPQYNDFMMTGGNKAPAVVGTPPAGYKIDYDGTGNPVSMSPIPGGPADTSKKDQVAAENRATSTDVITNASALARKALTAPGLLPATGTLSNLAAQIPESNAAELRRQVAVLKSNATIENLNAMRQQSPTGGALGNVTEGEGTMLAAKAGALDPNSPNFARDLDDYERTLLRIVHGNKVGDQIFDQTRPATSDTSKQSAPAASTGRVRKYNPATGAIE